MTWKPTKDPSIVTLLSGIEDDWGNPEERRKSLIPWGINIIDQVTYGIDFHNGGLVVWQGEEKNRKTTTVLNIVRSILMSGRWPDGWRIALDVAESGMPPKKCRDMLIAQVATDILIRWHWLGCDYQLDWTLRQPLPDRPADELIDVKNLGIDTKFLTYRKRTETQQAAITQAIDIIARWPLDIFGPSRDAGQTRSISISPQRWQHCIEERGARLIVYDHVQQMNTNGNGGDYDKLERVVPLIADVVVKNPGLVFFAVSQVSMGSVREAKSGLGNVTSRGGKKLQEEANDVFVVKYKDDGTTQKCVIELMESRSSPTVKVVQGIEPASGLFVGKAEYAGKYT